MTGGVAALGIIPGWSKSVASGVPRVSWTSAGGDADREVPTPGER
jgi:hypothetical protein